LTLAHSIQLLQSFPWFPSNPIFCQIGNFYYLKVLVFDSMHGCNLLFGLFNSLLIDLLLWRSPVSRLINTKCYSGCRSLIHLFLVCIYSVIIFIRRWRYISVKRCMLCVIMLLQVMCWVMRRVQRIVPLMAKIARRRSINAVGWLFGRKRARIAASIHFKLFEFKILLTVNNQSSKSSVSPVSL
jgi:hypothetical protein